MTKTCGIYSITNTVNGKVYIGQSTNIEARWSHHKCDMKHGRGGNKYMQSEYDVYGADCFQYTVLEECLPDKLYDLEMKYIKEANSTDREYGYNITKGGIHSGTFGSDNGMYGKKQSESTKALIRSRAIGRPGFWQGKHHTEETKRKLAKIKRENPSSRSTMILCVTTGEVFDMISKAKRRYGLKGNISVKEMCEQRKTYGKLPDGTPLVWGYVE